jgi:hypothetical protein
LNLLCSVADQAKKSYFVFVEVHARMAELADALASGDKTPKENPQC